MKIEIVVNYKTQGVKFDSLMDVKSHVLSRIKELVQTKPHHECMGEWLIANKKELVELLNIDVPVGEHQDPINILDWQRGFEI